MPARDSYSASTASKIRSYIRSNPGARAKEIAGAIGLRKETVNSYLYSRKTNALGGEVVQDGNYGWHLKAGSSSNSPQYSRPSSSSGYPSRPNGYSSNPQPSRRKRTAQELREELLEHRYEPEVIRAIFRSDDYYKLSDEEQGTLAEMLQASERERVMIEKRARELVTANQATQLHRKGNSNWVVVAVLSIYVGIPFLAWMWSQYQESMRQPIQTAPIERRSDR